MQRGQRRPERPPLGWIKVGLGSFVDPDTMNIHLFCQKFRGVTCTLSLPNFQGGRTNALGPRGKLAQLAPRRTLPIGASDALLPYPLLSDQPRCASCSSLASRRQDPRLIPADDKGRPAASSDSRDLPDEAPVGRVRAAVSDGGVTKSGHCGSALLVGPWTGWVDDGRKLDCDSGRVDLSFGCSPGDDC
jgi:hypothetical protein